MMEQVRAFIAIELPDQVKASLSSLERRLGRDEQPCVKWVDPEGVHLTLKFLGSIPKEKVPRIVEAIAQVANGASPLQLELGMLGAFPSLGRPQVIWVGITGDVERLSLLQKGIDQALIPLGFNPESRSFTPHLTLGRLRERASPEERKSIGELMKATEFESGSILEAREISLVRSKLTPTGAIYSRLASIQLESGLSTYYI